MRVLAALDKFRDSLSAAQACAIVAAAAEAAGRGWTADPCPLTDGGEGFASILTKAAGGETLEFTVEDPRGRPVRARVGLVARDRITLAARSLIGLGPDTERVAVVEMAEATGLARLTLAERDPFLASSFGTGQLISAAAGTRAAAVVLGIGGSATHDLGLGALEALGVDCLDERGIPVGRPFPARWPEIRGFSGRVVKGPRIWVACDVHNPLLGPRGAVAVYGPQKGLRATDAAALEAGTARMAGLICRHFDRSEELLSEPGAGAAGGLGFGLMAAAGAALVPGFELVAGWLDLDRRICECDLVVTGEGRFDESSLEGKGPGAVVRRALALGKPVQVFAGTVALAREIPGLATCEISPPELPFERALQEATRFLHEAALKVFHRL